MKNSSQSKILFSCALFLRLYLCVYLIPYYVECQDLSSSVILYDASNIIDSDELDSEYIYTGSNILESKVLNKHWQRRLSWQNMQKNVASAIRSSVFSPLHFATKRFRGSDRHKYKYGENNIVNSNNNNENNMMMLPSDNKDDNFIHHQKQLTKRLDPESTIELVVGTKLLSESLSVASISLGFVADFVRVSGDTAAGIIGSTVRFAGTAVKTIGGAIDSAGTAIDPDKNKHRSRDGISNMSQQQSRSQKYKAQLNDKHHLKVVQQTRKFVSRGMRLMGRLLGNIGSSIVAAGVASEQFSSSTVILLEETIRLLENFSGTLSSGLSPSHLRELANTDISEHQQHKHRDQNNKGPLISFGTHTINHDSSDQRQANESVELDSVLNRLMTKPTADTARNFATILSTQAASIHDFVHSDTAGVPSLALSVFLVLTICFFSSIYILKSFKGPYNDAMQQHSKIPHTIVIHEEQQIGSWTICLPDTQSTDVSFSSIQQDSTQEDMKTDSTINNTQSRQSWPGFGLMQNKKLRSFIEKTNIISSNLFGFLFNRYTTLFLLYAFAWFYLSWVAQLRGQSIQRISEAHGFRSAMKLIGKEGKSVHESVFWLDALLDKTWRVPFDPQSFSIHKSVSDLGYPFYVSRAVEQTIRSHPECNYENNDITDTPTFCLPYGGVEPFLAKHIGNALIKRLEESGLSAPNEVAYVSLYSLTLGSKPPTFRSVKIHGNDDDNQIDLDIEAEALLDDFELVFEVKLSSLEYALLPSTKVSIRAIGGKLPLKLSLISSTKAPFISSIEVSLYEVPDFQLQISPVVSESGLHALDVGSLPVVRNGLQYIVHKGLSQLVHPRYISIDLAELRHPKKPTSKPDSWMPQGLPEMVTLIEQTQAAPTLHSLASSSKSERFSVLASNAVTATAFAASTLAPTEAVVNVPQSSNAVVHVQARTNVSHMAMQRWYAKNEASQLSLYLPGNEEQQPTYKQTLWPTQKTLVVSPKTTLSRRAMDQWMLKRSDDSI